MLFTLAQLRKLPMPYKFQDDINIKDDLVGVEGILDIQNLIINGTISLIDDDSYKIAFNLKCTLVLESAISLKEIPYELDIDFTEYFSKEDDDESFMINGQTLDTKEAIITNILINKPVNISGSDEVFYDEDDTFEDDEEDNINEAFKSLKDLL